MIATDALQATTSSQAMADDSHESLRQLQTELLRQVSSAGSKHELLVALAGLITRFAQPVAIVYFERDQQGQLLNATRLYPARDDGQTKRMERQLCSACQTACRQGTLEVRRQGIPAHLIVAAPVVLQGRDPEAIGFIFSAGETIKQLIMLVQIVSSQLVIWHVLAASRQSEQDARASAALVELLTTIGAAPDLRSACFALAAELQTHLKCVRVAVGLRPAGNSHCRLIALSGVARFDLQSRIACAIEAAMDEAVLRGNVTVWPATDEESRHGALAHKNLCALEGVTSVVSTPLHDHGGKSIGALVLFHDSTDIVTPSQLFLQAADRPIARSLAIAMRLEGGRLMRLGRIIARNWRTGKTKIALVTAIMVIASMAIPLRYRLRCDCQIEPVTRRYIAAPFEGTLERSLVKPGDTVHEGDLLARMNGREIRWKQASVAADQNQAIKKRDKAQAAHNYADMQIAALEVERFDLELKLLEHRADHLDIKSPVAGIVVSGDLDRAEGAPLVIGQTLFEIAPLQKMVVEVALPDEDVSLVRKGQPVYVRLDAFPHDDWQAELTQIHPRSEIRDQKNVFVAVADLDNREGRLSPGMKGRASVQTEYRPLGWILFHKPWEYITKKLSW